MGIRIYDFRHQQCLSHLAYSRILLCSYFYEKEKEGKAEREGERKEGRAGKKEERKEGEGRRKEGKKKALV